MLSKYFKLNLIGGPQKVKGKKSQLWPVALHQVCVMLGFIAALSVVVMA